MAGALSKGWFVTVAGLAVDLDRIAAICRRYGVARLQVFGPVTRGEAQPESDVDILYDLAPGARLGWGIEDLSHGLSEAVDRPVDLISRRALHERLRDTVFAEARTLCAT